MQSHLGLKIASERDREAARPLPRADELGSFLYDVAQTPATGAIIEDVDVMDDLVKISRIESGKLWFEGSDGLEIGPRAVPQTASQVAAVGWEVSVARFVRTRTGWHLVEIGNVYPK